MNIWDTTNWFALQSKPHQEKLAAAHVEKLDVEVFLPKIRRDEMICGASRVVTRPLFPGYFFARFCPSLSYASIQSAHGVVRVLGNHRFPIPLETEIISAIRNRVQSDGFIPLEPAVFRPGDKVTIEDGPFAGWVGKVEREWDDGKRVLILLDFMRRAQLLIEKRCLSMAAETC